MKRIDFGDVPSGRPDRSAELFPAFGDTDCEHCGTAIWEGDSLGFVRGEKACEWCWDEAE